MNNINNIYTTVSKGQVHIAADTQYVGSVDSYNNPFTQLFAWLFQHSIPVNFDGKVRSVNKESYTNLIRSLVRNEKINDVSQYNLFRLVAERAALPVTTLKMRDVIATADRQALFQKLATAISQGDTAKALLMIGKGAELDAVYYDRDHLGVSFYGDTTYLSSQNPYKFNVFAATPIFQAARKGNLVICKFLEEAGASLSILGKQYTFKREVVDVSTRLETVMKPIWIPHHYCTQDARGRVMERVSYKVEYRPDLQEKTYVTTQDSRSDERHYRLQQNNFNLVELS